MTVLYFAYGSNMSTERMSSRASSAKTVGRARIPDKRLVYNKRSKDGSGRANLVDSPGDEVWGVLYEVETDQLVALDRTEGGYERQEVSVITEQGQTIQAVVYISDQLTDTPIPYDWYKQLIVSGAREHQLPEHYIELLEALPAKSNLREQSRR